MEFRKRSRRKRPALFKLVQWHFYQDNAPVHNSILVTDYLTKMGIKTVLQPPYTPDLAPCDFWLFPKLRGCRYETIEEMWRRSLTRSHKRTSMGPWRSCWKGTTRALQLEEITSKGTKMPIRKKSGNLSYAPRKSLLFGQRWHIHVKEFTRGRCPYFISKAQHILFVLLEYIVRWKVSGRRTAVLRGVVSSIWSK